MTLAQVQAESGPLWLEIQAAITAAHEQARDEGNAKVATTEAAALAAQASRDKTIADLQTQLQSAQDQLQSATKHWDAVIAQLTQERDAQVTRVRGLAAAALEARQARKAADAAYVEIDAREDAIIAESSKTLDEQAAAQKAARLAEIEAEKAKLLA